MEKDNFLTVLQEQLIGYENELNKLEKEKQSFDEKIDQLERCIERVKLLEEAERTRIGRLKKVTPLPAITEDMFKGMSLSVALKTLLKGKPGMNLRQIEQYLRQGGFQFDDNRKPGRRIIMWWFEFVLVLTGYMAIASQLVGKGLGWLIVTLFIWLIFYLAGKIILRNDIVKQ